MMSSLSEPDVYEITPGRRPQQKASRDCHLAIQRHSFHAPSTKRPPSEISPLKRLTWAGPKRQTLDEPSDGNDNDAEAIEKQWARLIEPYAVSKEDYLSWQVREMEATIEFANIERQLGA